MRLQDLSARTLGVLTGGIVAVAAIATLVALEVGGESGVLWVSDAGETLVIGISAAIILSVALRFGPTEPLRRQWLPIGLGVAAFAVGDLIWTYIEAYQGLEPAYPGVTDIFYLLMYPLFALGLLRAGLAYKGLVDLKRPAMIAGAVTIVAGAALFFGLIQPYVLAEDLEIGEKVLSTFYPLGDLLLGFAPALFIILIVSRLGGGRLGWPWWSVAAGVLLIAAADTGYSLMSAYKGYESGAIIDYGWSFGSVLIAVGASIAHDLARPRVRTSVASRT